MILEYLSRQSFLTSGIKPLHVGSLRTKFLDRNCCDIKVLVAHSSKCVKKLCCKEVSKVALLYIDRSF